MQDDITLEKYSAAIRLGAAHGALLFVSPTGSGTGCTSRAPCGLREALRQAAFGDTVTLYNGIYGGEQERK